MSIITDLLMINYSRYLGIRANKKLTVLLEQLVYI